MGTHTPDMLWSLWQQETIDSETAIGHILQNLVAQHQAQTTSGLSLARLRSQIETQQSEVALLRLAVERLQTSVNHLATLVEQQRPATGK